VSDYRELVLDKLNESTRLNDIISYYDIIFTCPSNLQSGITALWPNCAIACVFFCPKVMMQPAEAASSPSNTCFCWRYADFRKAQRPPSELWLIVWRSSTTVLSN